jgi:hypothetical protein
LTPVLALLQHALELLDAQHVGKQKTSLVR